MADRLTAPVVIDTNIVLDMWVFEDTTSQPLRDALESNHLQWIATEPMREELVRVLAYPQIAKSLAHHGRCAESVLAQRDRLAQPAAVAAKAPVTCKDPDDQKFIDLAVVHAALLLSKDRAVLCMARRLHKLGASVAAGLALRL